MKTLDLRDGTTLTIDGDKITSNNPSLGKLANTILAGTFGKFGNSEVYPNKENAIALFLSKELALNRNM